MNLRAVKKGKRRHPSLKRILKRGIDVRITEPDDLQYFYAALQQGAFDEYMKLDRDMTPKVFLETFAELLGTDTMVYTSEIDGKPGCAIYVTLADERIEVHVTWFPWSTDRYRIETAAKFFNEFNKKFTILTVSSTDNILLALQVKKYGLLRQIGKSLHYFGKDKPGYFFEGVRKWEDKK